MQWSIATNREAWKVLEKFDRPFLTAYSDSDPVTSGGEKAFQTRVPGAKGQPHTTIANAGHFSKKTPPNNSPRSLSNSSRTTPRERKPR